MRGSTKIGLIGAIVLNFCLSTHRAHGQGLIVDQASSGETLVINLRKGAFDGAIVSSTAPVLVNQGSPFFTLLLWRECFDYAEPVLLPGTDCSFRRTCVCRIQVSFELSRRGSVDQRRIGGRFGRFLVPRGHCRRARTGSDLAAPARSRPLEPLQSSRETSRSLRRPWLDWRGCVGKVLGCHAPDTAHPWRFGYFRTTVSELQPVLADANFVHDRHFHRAVQ